MMAKTVKRYLYFLILLVVLLILTIIDYDLGKASLDITLYSLKEMIQVIPPIFVLLGLLDVWVPRDSMMKYMGEKSGITGILLSILLGSAAAGPLYGAFPIAAVFMKKGVKFSNILIFIGAWSTTKIPMFLFEMASLGSRFALTRLLVDIPGIIIIAMLLAKLIPGHEVEKIYAQAEKL